MKLPFCLALAGIFLFSLTPSRAADSGDVESELRIVIGNVQSKLREGKTTEENLAPELKEFDDIITKHSSEKIDDVANVLLMKAVLYIEILGDDAKGSELIDRLKKEYPGTKSANSCDRIVEGVKKTAAAKKIRATLTAGAPFPDFEEQDLDGKPLSPAALKGKVVLVDFWATWAAPSVDELPYLIATYQKYHDKGFDIIGISLDKDRTTLTSFLENRKIGWPQYFDGLGWKNKLALKYGVNTIPAGYLLDRNGHILTSNIRGAKLENAVAGAIDGN